MGEFDVSLCSRSGPGLTRRRHLERATSSRPLYPAAPSASGPSSRATASTPCRATTRSSTRSRPSPTRSAAASSRAARTAPSASGAQKTASASRRSSCRLCRVRPLLGQVVVLSLEHELTLLLPLHPARSLVRQRARQRRHRSGRLGRQRARLHPHQGACRERGRSGGASLSSSSPLPRLGLKHVLTLSTSRSTRSRCPRRP